MFIGMVLKIIAIKMGTQRSDMMRYFHNVQGFMYILLSTRLSPKSATRKMRYSVPIPNIFSLMKCPIL